MSWGVSGSLGPEDYRDGSVERELKALSEEATAIEKGIGSVSLIILQGRASSLKDRLDSLKERIRSESRTKSKVKPKTVQFMPIDPPDPPALMQMPAGPEREKKARKILEELERLEQRLDELEGRKTSSTSSDSSIGSSKDRSDSRLTLRSVSTPEKVLDKATFLETALDLCSSEKQKKTLKEILGKFLSKDLEPRAFEFEGDAVKLSFNESKLPLGLSSQVLISMERKGDQLELSIRGVRRQSLFSIGSAALNELKLSLNREGGGGIAIEKEGNSPMMILLAGTLRGKDLSHHELLYRLNRVFPSS